MKAKSTGMLNFTNSSGNNIFNSTKDGSPTRIKIDVKNKKLKNKDISVGKIEKYRFPNMGEEPLTKRPVIIGAGPAGLSCAYFLAIKGYSVEIFESEEKGGGMLRYGIHAYRLPKDILDKEIENIEKMGVEIHYNKRLGRDFTVQSLKGDFDAVFVAIGAWSASSMRCAGEDADGVFGGIDVLYKVAKGEKVDLGKKVCVVGGGNTAIDAVRTAVRLGAEEVNLIYRRTENEMPAEPDEIRDARAEGVNFKFLCAPVEVINENGKVTGLKVQKMELGEPDASGRRSPVRVEGETEILYCDTIISAIGQQVVSEDIKELDMKVFEYSDEKGMDSSIEISAKYGKSYSMITTGDMEIINAEKNFLLQS